MITSLAYIQSRVFSKLGSTISIFKWIFGGNENKSCSVIEYLLWNFSWWLTNSLWSTLKQRKYLALLFYSIVLGGGSIVFINVTHTEDFTNLKCIWSVKYSRRWFSLCSIMCLNWNIILRSQYEVRLKKNKSSDGSF